jgi:AraC-like DNA-binding protein
MRYYEEYPPHPALAAHVACLWASASPAGAQFRVLPDNCIDILFQDVAPGGFVAGMMTTAFALCTPRPVHTVAVRFKPGAAARFFSMPLVELTDGAPALEDVWGKGEAARLSDALWNTRAADPRARLAVLEQHLLQRLAARSAPSRGSAWVVHQALALVEAAHGDIRIDALAATVGVSRQHLASLFRDQVGISAKLFARICRFQHSIAALRAGEKDFSALAVGHGYADQAHLNHEFRELGGLTPSELLR